MTVRIDVDDTIHTAIITNSDGSTIKLTNIHSPEQCAGRNCVLHNPSNHHMRDWDINVRWDKGMLFERLCEHEVGHPDPDSVAFFEEIGIEGMDVHGCCGDCAINRAA